MNPGIRATVEFDTPAICPIAELSAEADATIDSVTANVCACGSPSVIDFSTQADLPHEGDITPVFSYGSTHRYRFTLEDGISCPCECLGKHECTVSQYVAREGTLRLVFHAIDYDQLRSVVTDLRDRFPDVDIKRVIRSPNDDRPSHNVLVDRGKLTSRQLEVLETAYEMGYFDRPRGANATTIASELDIDPSTFREHLSAAESKLIGDVL